MPQPNSAAAIVAPVGLGLFSLGLVFGLVVVHAGLGWWWATVFTAVVYVGSLVFLLVGLATAAVPLLQVASTTLIVHLRHVFYALSFPLDRVRGPLAKVYSTYALIDEAYAVSSAKPSIWTSRRILLVQGVFQFAWVSGATIGALAGSALPIERAQGVDFALTALFVVLAIDAYRVRPVPALAIGAALCARGAAVGSRRDAGVGVRRVHRAPDRPPGSGTTARCRWLTTSTSWLAHYVVPRRSRARLQWPTTALAAPRGSDDSHRGIASVGSLLGEGKFHVQETASHRGSNGSRVCSARRSGMGGSTGRPRCR